MGLFDLDIWKAGLRTAAAGAISFVLAELLALPQGYWSVLTSIMIMQASVGASLQAAANRLLGTFAGGALGFLLVSVTPSTSFGTLVGLMLACGLLAMLATRYPNLRIAPMTAAILFVSPQSHASPLISGLHRVLEIAIGCCVGIAVALLVAPARAESRLRAEVGHALGLIAKLITLGIEAPDGQTNDDSVATVSEDIYAASRALDALSQESRAERSSHLSRSRLDPERLQRALRKLRMVAFALEHVTRLSWPILDPGRARSLRTAIVSAHDYLMALGPALVAGAQPPPLKALETSLVQFANTAAVTHHTRGVGEAIHPSSDQPLSKARDQTEAFVGAISLTLDELHLALEELVECIADAGSDSA